MEFGWSEEQTQLRDTIADFARSELNDGLLDREARGEFNRAGWRRCAEMGVHGLPVPAEYGGMGLDALTTMGVLESLGYGCKDNGLVFSINAHMWTLEMPLLGFGTEAQKARYLQKILAADELWCQLYSEPNAGSDLASLRTTAEDRGDHFVVNGQKIWTSGGLIADWGLLLARTDARVPKHRGISCFLLSMRQPGVEVRPLKQITGSAEFAEVFMTDARVEKADLVGRLGQGWEIAQTTLSYERGANSLARVTRYAAAFRKLVDATRALRRNGRPLLEDPLVRSRIGRIYAELEVQRYAALRVLSALNKGDSPGAASSITKLSYSEFEKRYYELAQEILGPYGQVGEGAPEPFLADVDSSAGVRSTWAYGFLWSRAGTIYAGSSEIQRNVIGERVLGLPKEVRADRKA